MMSDSCLLLLHRFIYVADVDEPDFIVNPSDFRRTDVKSVPRESSMVSNPIVNK